MRSADVSVDENIKGLKFNEKISMIDLIRKFV